MFAYEASGIVPDAIILSKALGGGYPLALVAYHERFDKWMPGAHTGTFRGNQIGLVAGAATMAYLLENRLPELANEKGARLQKGLQRMAERHACIGEIRGRGLMVGAEIIDPTQPDAPHLPRRLDGDLARDIKRECFARGLILETGGRHGGVLRFLPPLVITEQEIDAALDILKASISKITEDCGSRLPELRI